MAEFLKNLVEYFRKCTKKACLVVVCSIHFRTEEVLVKNRSFSQAGSSYPVATSPVGVGWHDHPPTEVLVCRLVLCVEVLKVQVDAERPLGWKVLHVSVTVLLAFAARQTVVRADGASVLPKTMSS